MTANWIHLLVLAEAALIVVLASGRWRVAKLAREMENSESQLLESRAELKEQLRFERLGTDISNMLMHAPAEEFGEEVVPALGDVATLLGFDVATLSLFTGKDAGVVAYVWHEPDTPGLPASPRRSFHGRHASCSPVETWRSAR